MNIFTLLLPVFLKWGIFQPVSGTNCTPNALDYHPSIGIQVEYVDYIPTNTTAPGTYNMNVEDNFDNILFFLDQLMGKIYQYDGDSVSKVFDITSSPLPQSITLDWKRVRPPQTNKIHAMTQGSSRNEVYVVFTSTTFPSGFTEAQAKLPPDGAFPGYICADPPRFYQLGSDGSFTNPEAFFVLENQLSGHLGGGIVTLADGRILWGVGDCLPFGADGHYVPQMDCDDCNCGKILLINPSNGSFEVVAKGVRNSQQMRIINRPHSNGTTAADTLVFMDIGGVTAEEVNVIPIHKLTNLDKVENFGWGRNINDGLSREGTFYVGPGVIGVVGTDPPCEGDAPILEAGYVQPWIQFGRTVRIFLLCHFQFCSSL